jgi:hypothetical protein
VRLETHAGAVADPATVSDIARAVDGLTEIGEAYVILSDDRAEETYVQAAGTVGEKFLVEYRDGGAGDHFRGDRRVTADELVIVLTAYLRRAPDWSVMLAWHRLRVDQPRPSA